MGSCAAGKTKIKAHVDQQLSRELKEAKKKKKGWVIVKGECMGKLAMRTEEAIKFDTREEAVDHAKQGGRLTLSKQQLDDSTEGNCMTVECWKIQPKNGEHYYWFVERH